MARRTKRLAASPLPGVKSGVAGFDGETMAPVRVRNDPMGACYAILRPYVRPVLA